MAKQDKVTRETLVASALAMIASVAGDPVDYAEKRAELLSQADQHKIGKRYVMEDDARGLDSREVFSMALAKTEDVAKQTLLQTKLDLVEAYYAWKESVDVLDKEREEALAPYREVLTAICAITGDKIQHVTHLPRGNKTGSSGERINHGNMAYVINMSTGEKVLHPETHEDKWHSANEMVREFAPESLSYIYEMVEVDGERVRKLDENGEPIHVTDKQGNKKTYNVNGETAVRILKKKGYEVQFI